MDDGVHATPDLVVAKFAAKDSRLLPVVTVLLTRSLSAQCKTPNDWAFNALALTPADSAQR